MLFNATFNNSSVISWPLLKCLYQARRVSGYTYMC